jgi:hypothetical protein
MGTPTHVELKLTPSGPYVGRSSTGARQASRLRSWSSPQGDKDGITDDVDALSVRRPAATFDHPSLPLRASSRCPNAH